MKSTDAECGRRLHAQGFKYLWGIMPLLERLRGSGRDRAGNRTLFYDQYVTLVLLAMFSPTIRTLRDISLASDLQAVRKKLGVKHISLGSFSESSHLFDPSLLQEVIAELSQDLRPIDGDPRLKDIRHCLTLVDATLVRSLPRMAQAMWTGGADGSVHHGWKLHAHFQLDTHTPSRIDLSPPLASEKGVLAEHLLPDRCYVLDRGYHGHQLFDAIHSIASSYVCRIRDNSQLLGGVERPLTAQAKAAGVVSDTVGQLGVAQSPPHPVRVIQVTCTPHRRDSHRVKGYHGPPATETLRIATDLLDVPAEIIALIYQHRWTIEIFFRFFKHVLGCRHLLSAHPNGITIQVYCAIIACLLLNRWTGARPGRQAVTMFAWHFMGWADQDELERFLTKPDNTGIKQKAKDQLWKKLGVN